MSRLKASPTCCVKCGAQIFWAKARNGDRIPLDIGNTVDGKIHVNIRDEILPLNVCNLPFGHKAHAETCSAKRRKAVGE